MTCSKFLFQVYETLEISDFLELKIRNFENLKLFESLKKFLNFWSSKVFLKFLNFKKVKYFQETKKQCVLGILEFLERLELRKLKLMKFLNFLNV